jgi:hypothetical protein
MDYSKLKVGDYVKIEFSNSEVAFYQILGINNKELLVKLRNLHVDREENLPLELIKPIVTKAHHFEKIGFSKEIWYSDVKTGGKPVEKYALGDIEINYLDVRVPLELNMFNVIEYGYTAIKSTIDKAEVTKHIQDGNKMSKEFRKEYPSFYYLNSLFDYLDSKGIEYNKEEVVLTEA